MTGGKDLRDRSYVVVSARNPRPQRLNPRMTFREAGGWIAIVEQHQADDGGLANHVATRHGRKN